MHTNVILTNKRRTHAQSNYTNTKLKAWFKRLLRHPARKRSGPILHPRRTRGVEIQYAVACENRLCLAITVKCSRRKILL